MLRNKKTACLVIVGGLFLACLFNGFYGYTAFLGELESACELI